MVNDVLEKVEGTILNETVETFSEGLVMEECAVDFALEEVVVSIICDIVNTSRKDFSEHYVLAAKPWNSTLDLPRKE